MREKGGRCGLAHQVCKCCDVQVMLSDDDVQDSECIGSISDSTLAPSTTHITHTADGIKYSPKWIVIITPINFKAKKNLSPSTAHWNGKVSSCRKNFFL